MDDIDRAHAELRAARTQFDEAKSEVAEMEKAIASVLKAIRGNGYRTGSRDFKPGFMPGVSSWVDDLPERSELTEVLTRWRNAQKRLVAVYDALPADERKHVAALPNSAT